METINITLYKKHGSRNREVCTVEYHIPAGCGEKHTPKELAELKRNGYNSPKRISRKELNERLAEGGYESIYNDKYLARWRKRN